MVLGYYYIPINTQPLNALYIEVMFPLLTLLLVLERFSELMKIGFLMSFKCIEIPMFRMF